MRRNRRGDAEARFAPAPRVLCIVAAMWLRIALVGLVFAGCASNRATFASRPGASPAFDRAASDAKALEIADRVVAAAGGAEHWNAARQIRWSESVSTEPGTPAISFEEAWDRWNGRHHYRLHSTGGDAIVMRELYGSRETVFGEVGHNRQSITGADAEHVIASAHERWELDTTLLFLPFLLEAPGNKLALVGEFPTEDGQPPLDELKLSFDPKDPSRTATYHVMVNRTTNRIERIEIVKAGDPDTRRLGYRPSAWSDVGGMKLATTYTNIGMPSEVITYAAVKVSAEPDDELYVPVTQ
jgi:hypothetical protein